jgi:hypothetical protein
MHVGSALQLTDGLDCSTVAQQLRVLALRTADLLARLLQFLQAWETKPLSKQTLFRGLAGRACPALDDYLVHLDGSLGCRWSCFCVHHSLYIL